MVTVGRDAIVVDGCAGRCCRSRGLRSFGDALWIFSLRRYALVGAESPKPSFPFWVPLHIHSRLRSIYYIRYYLLLNMHVTTRYPFKFRP